MIKYNDLIIFTLVIDLILIYIYNTSKLNKFDKNNILTLFFVHVVFYIALINKYHLILDISHLFFVIQVYIISLLSTNIKILLLYVFIIVVMLFYWIIDKKCPLGRYERIKWMNKFSARNEIVSASFPFIVLPILFYKIYNAANS